MAFWRNQKINVLNSYSAALKEYFLLSFNLFVLRFYHSLESCFVALLSFVFFEHKSYSADS